MNLTSVTTTYVFILFPKNEKGCKFMEREHMNSYFKREKYFRVK